MNRKIWMGIGCAAILGMCCSCYEDKGNYDYDRVNEVSLAAKLTDTTVQQGTVLRLTPEPVNMQPEGTVEIDTAEYTFCWEAVVDYNKKEVLSTQRNLNDTIWLPIGKSYQINYVVTEKASGVSWRERFYLKVVQRLTEGLLLMTEDEEKNVGLEIYASDTKGEKVHETGILERSAFPYRSGGARFVASTKAGSYKYLWVATGEGTGWLELPDFSWDETQTLRMLMVKQEPVSYTLCNITQLNGAGMGITFGFTEDGNVHPYNVNNIVYPDIAYANMRKFKASPWLGGNRNAALFFDTDRGRFVMYGMGTYGWQSPGSNVSDVADEVAFEGSTLLFMSMVKDRQTVAVLKDKEGKYWKCLITIGGGYFTPEPVIERYELSASIAMLEHADSKAVDWTYKNIYFTSGNKLYCYRSGSGIDDCRKVNILHNGQKVAPEEVVAVIMVPSAIQDNIADKLYISTYSSEHKGRVYVTQPEAAEPLNLVVLEVVPSEGRVKSLCKFSN